MQATPFAAPAPYFPPQPRYQPYQPQQHATVIHQPPQPQPRYQPRPDPTPLPEPEPLAPVASHTIEVPPPEQLGIHLDQPATPRVVVPDPAKLGIRLD